MVSALYKGGSRGSWLREWALGSHDLAVNCGLGHWQQGHLGLLLRSRFQFPHLWNLILREIKWGSTIQHFVYHRVNHQWWLLTLSFKTSCPGLAACTLPSPHCGQGFFSQTWSRSTPAEDTRGFSKVWTSGAKPFIPFENAMEPV